MPNENELTLNDIDNMDEEQLQAALEAESGESAYESGTNEPEPDQIEEEQSAKEPTLEDRLKSLEEANAKLEKRVRDQNQFIETRNAEIGLLKRKQRERELEALPDDVDVNSDEFLTDPKAAIKKVLDAREKKNQILDDDKAERARQFEEQSRALITDVDPDFEESTSKSILEILKEDGAPDKIIDDFRNKPYTMFNPAVTLQLIHRARLTKKIKELESQLAEAQAKPGKLVENIRKHSGAKSKVVSSPPSTSGAASRFDINKLTEADINKMSYEQLKQLEAQL